MFAKWLMQYTGNDSGEFLPKSEVYLVVGKTPGEKLCPSGSCVACKFVLCLIHSQVVYICDESKVVNILDESKVVCILDESEMVYIFDESKVVNILDESLVVYI